MLSAEGVTADREYDRLSDETQVSAEVSPVSEADCFSFPGALNIALMMSVLTSTAILYLYIRPAIELVSLAPYVLIISTCLVLSVYIDRRSSFGEIFQERMQLLLKGVVFIFIALATLRIFNHLTMSLAFPLADTLLDSWDKALGLNWLAYFSFVQVNPVLVTVLDAAYIGFDGASLFGFLALVVMGYSKRARYFCEVFLITAAVSTTVALFFPAVAAVVLNFGPVDHIEGFSTVPGVYHLEQFLSLRADDVPSINLLSAAGLATFPSFHAAGGVLLIAGFLRTRLSWIVSLFALVMIASVPIFGGHYFVDVIAGVALAVTVCILNACRPCYRGLFGKDTSNY
ncbi:MAG: hypothetical protein Tsb0019_32600 [Roseibium sp.]